MAGLSPSTEKCFIDCNAQLLLPAGWSIQPEDQIASRVCREIEFDPAKVVCHLTEEQKTGRIKGTKLKERLEGKLVLNACVLDMLLANTAMIPDSWKKDEAGNTRYTCFWGTIYRDRDGNLYVRYLYWLGGQWYWDYRCLTRGFVAESPAAILAS